MNSPFSPSDPYFQVTTLSQVVGTLLCLHAGTKISSKAHNIVAVACRWHALATCKPFEGSWRSNAESFSRSASLGSLTSTFSESDLSTLDGLQLPNRSQLASMPSYNERQSFGKSYFICHVYYPFLSMIRNRFVNILQAAKKFLFVLKFLWIVNSGVSSAQ